MKWLKGPAAIVFLLAALVFAYTRFESSFNPRRGQGKGGPPPMPAMAMRMMAKHNGKRAATSKSHSKKPGAKEMPQASSPTGDTGKQKPAKGDD